MSEAASIVPMEGSGLLPPPHVDRQALRLLFCQKPSAETIAGVIKELLARRIVRN